ncbi:MAG: BMP family ABC transporter substrate-binding protein [Acetivibrio sp.]
MKKGKKVLSLLLAAVMIMGTFTGCGSDKKETAAGGKTETKRIALITDPVGTNPFLTQIVDKLDEIKETGTYPIEYSLVECTDGTAWSENVRASVEENYDLIMAVGFKAADPMKQVSEQFPDKAKYVVIDTTCDSPYVKSYIFKPQEGAYLVGAMAALISADMGKPKGPFGAVHANPGQGSFEWRYGYMEGAKAVNPEIQTSDFIFNYTKSYSDAPIAKELALQQAAQGCTFINAASAVADFGTFEAAKEKGFYTSGQDFDRTDPNNEFIVTTQVKYTGLVAEQVVKDLFDEKIEPGVTSLGLADGVIGATYITDDGVNPRSKVLTDEIIKQVKGYAEDIKSGKLKIEVPLEADYK